MDQLWRDWRDRFGGWTLFESSRPRGLSLDNASGELNLAFARALNGKLAAEAPCGEPYFDLVVVDEAQCLRNPDNQTNSVLYEALKCQVAKWLFMSATPAHGGPGDIPRIVNKYPNCGEILDCGLASDLGELQKALGDFMVRRQRRYLAKDRPTMVGKDEYRDHDRMRWALEGADMSALNTLAMGLVQKGLVDVLANRNNRYRIGFLSSFESLQSSIRPVERAADFEHHHTQGSLPHAADGSVERDAPDTGFIDELTADFQKRFDMPLPHAKVDSVVDRIAPLAFADTVLDLYFADEAVGKTSQELAERFLRWLKSDDLGAAQVRSDCAQWLGHLRLIVDGCLDGAGRHWHELVHEQEETWAQLFEPGPVVGVTGGSGGHRRAVRQFRTPSLPRVIVCADTLKEGVDLHLFCDHVLHYGVAWTSGDTEQRVGRVDRYFSQIERRLAGEGPPPDVKLHVGYPHVVASLERGQVERVIQRQRDVEALMGSPLAGTGDDERELGEDASVRLPSSQQGRQPFDELRFPNRRRSIAAVSNRATRADREHYRGWYGALRRKLAEQRWCIGGDGSMAGDVAQPARRATLMLEREERQHEIEWSFDAALRRYVMTLASPPWPTDAMFSGGERRRRIVGRERLRQSFVRLLVPTPDEGADETMVTGLIDILEGIAPKANAGADAFWGEALAALSPDAVDWESDHKARLTVRRGERAQRVTVYAYEGSVRAVSVVSATPDRLGHRTGWAQPPSAEDVREWILDANNELPLGYLDLHKREGLVFGIHVLHGDLSREARRRLLEEVGWRADSWSVPDRLRPTVIRSAPQILRIRGGRGERLR